MENSKIWTTSVTNCSSSDLVSDLANTILWLLFFINFIIFLIYNFYFSFQYKIFDVLFYFVFILGGLFIFRRTRQGIKSLIFFSSSLTELKKIVWPSKNEVFHSTLIVLVIILITSIFVYFYGLFIMSIIRLILG